MAEITKESVRKLAIKLLDDGEGICEDGVIELKSILVDSGNEDFLRYINATDGRFYIDEDIAELLLKEIENERTSSDTEISGD